MSIPFPVWAVSEEQQDLYTDARSYGLEIDDPILQNERQVRRFVSNKRAGKIHRTFLHLAFVLYCLFYFTLSLVDKLVLLSSFDCTNR